MKRLVLVALCLITLTTLAACVDWYDRATYPEARYDPGDQ
jgi:hypothetical protein